VDTDSPSEIAREALRQLALRKVPPTPDNYRELYFQIRGSGGEETFPVRALKTIASALPRTRPADLHSAQAFDAAIASGQWAELRQVILNLYNTLAGEEKPWNTLVYDLIVQFERPHGELTQARKREALKHVLAANPDADRLHARLSALIRSWSQAGSNSLSPLVEAQPADDKLATDTPDNAPSQAAATTTVPDDTLLRPLLARLLTDGIVPLASDDESLSSEARTLARALLGANGSLSSDMLVARLDGLVSRLEWIGEEHHAVRTALLDLLHLIVDNIRELVIDDSWLYGQLSTISLSFSGPLNLRMLDDIGQQLRDVIDKQSHLKHDLAEARTRMKAMLAGFIDRLSEVSVFTSDYQDLLGRSAQQISAATSVNDLSAVVSELLISTRQTHESTQRAGQDLSALREQVEHANQEIARLQRELDAASRLVRHDPLTGALNRKGLDEAMAREVSRMQRKGTPLCIALLDIDNFKHFNDVYGHATGDEALCHLTRVVTETLRPQDVVARYGGEEFIILLPDTPLDTANSVLVRLQRELTRRIFCAPNSERLLITFSAGVTLLRPDEQSSIAINRADEAMYAAKRAGKNRVLVA
jgi:diguanylate cyclase